MSFVVAVLIVIGAFFWILVRAIGTAMRSNRSRRGDSPWPTLVWGVILAAAIISSHYLLPPYIGW